MTDPKSGPPVDLALTREGGRDGTIAEPTFSGVMSFMRRRYAKDVTGADVAVVGVPFDIATTGRPGARYGPRAVRQGSAMIAWDAVWGWPFDPFERLDVVDYGDIAVDYGSPIEIVGCIESQFAAIHRQGVASLMLGGDHFCTYPVIRSLAVTLDRPLSLIHFDAHSDTWPAKEGQVDHGTMFWRAAQDGVIDPARSIQLGIRTNNADTLGFTVLTADDVDSMSAAEIGARVAQVVGDNPAYLTFDIDFLDPAFAPGTGTPVAGGIGTLKAFAILRALARIDVRSADVVEVAPAYDSSDVTALAGATAALHCLALMAARKPTGA
ncbi:MAG: agmatinase [Erythrobacter sp. RIFCSPHIGHO2_12_FULL_63_10]|nr:MAG: agmatinase [Erythrobacter sp. RIFCSPHIGHO2_12_FULL_63_10]